MEIGIFLMAFGFSMLFFNRKKIKFKKNDSNFFVDCIALSIVILLVLLLVVLVLALNRIGIEMGNMN